MHDDTNNKRRDSATTSTSKPRPHKPSEAEYLEREADDARDAASHTLGQMRQSLKDASDVRAWARTYPWTTMGAAAAAGFLAVAAVMPGRKPRQDEENTALLERVLTDEQIEARLRELAAEDVGKPSRDGLLHTLAGSLVKTFGPAVQTAVAAALAGQPQPDETTNGAPSAEAHDADSTDETGSSETESSEPPPLPE